MCRIQIMEWRYCERTGEGVFTLERKKIPVYYSICITGTKKRLPKQQSPLPLYLWSRTKLCDKYSIMAKGKRKRSKMPSKVNKFPYVWPLATLSVIILLAVLFREKNDNFSDVFLGEDYEYQSEPKLLSKYPRIYFLPDVLSDLECDALVGQAEKATRFQSTAGAKKNNKWRTSITASLRKDDKGSTPVINRLVKRISKAANVSESIVRGGNPLQVTQYEPGGRYLPHTDSRQLHMLDEVAITKRYEVLNNYPVHGGYPYTARHMTVLCYLNDSYEEGATVFPLANKDGSYKQQPSEKDLRGMQNEKHQVNIDNWEKLLPPMCADKDRFEGISIKPVKGSCALFYNHLEDDEGGPGALDGLALHAGCDVKNGSKWITNVWIEMLPKSKRKNSNKEL